MSILSELETNEVDENFIRELHKKYTKQEIIDFISTYLEEIKERNDLSSKNRQELYTKIAVFLSTVEDLGDMNYERLRPKERENTNFSDDPVSSYLATIGKYRLLTSLEEIRVVRDLALKDEVLIFNEQEKTLNIGKVLLSIKTKEQQEEIFRVLKRLYTHPYMVGTYESENILQILYNYQKLEKELNHIPNKEELSKILPETINITDQELLSEEELANQLKIFSKYKLARNTLFYSNLKLVITLLKKYHRRLSNEDEMDLILEGNKGLMAAIDSFDYRKGLRFSTLAYLKIKESMISFIAKNRLIALSRYANSLAIKVATETQKLEEIYDVVTPQMISKRLNIPEEKVILLQQLAQAPLSLDCESLVDPKSTILDFIASDEESAEDMLIEKDRDARIRKIMTELNPKYFYIMTSLFGFNDGNPKTGADLAEEFGVSRQRIEQIKRRAIGQIGPKIKRKALGDS